ncbi:PepSY domain-containing protein [Sphingomonas sp.]|uniref:PepSY domain-containing protein n=1 Tax=Sphingomonas sp. TaxID=28214 RepID=UPI0025D9DD88|nr:PepSY domain-containing protein [Sphingomonas sp.]
MASPVAAPGPHGRFQEMQFVRASVQRNQDNLSAREIVERVKPLMGDATYLGFLYDPATNIYTLKFLRNGSVIWVDVDARTGRVLRRSGN